VTHAAARPDELLAQAARLGVAVRPGSAPGKLKLTGPAEAVQRLVPLVAQHKAALLQALAEQPAPSAREAHEAYLAHHLRCPTCRAAGRGYGRRCAEGARLWSSYSEAAQREHADREAAKQPAPEPEAPTLTPEQRRRLWRGQPATDVELERMAARVQRAERLGLRAHEADALADRLHLRDRDCDDRRLCIECRHVRAGWRCAALGQPIPREWVTSRLQRCEHFRGASEP